MFGRGTHRTTASGARADISTFSGWCIVTPARSARQPAGSARSKHPLVTLACTLRARPACAPGHVRGKYRSPARRNDVRPPGRLLSRAFLATFEVFVCSADATPQSDGSCDMAHAGGPGSLFLWLRSSGRRQPRPVGMGRTAPTKAAWSVNSDTTPLQTWTRLPGSGHWTLRNRSNRLR